MKFKLNDYESKDAMRFLRDCTDLSREEFGKSIGKTAKTIKSYENGERNYTVRLLKDIAKKYDFDIIIEKRKK